MSRIAVVRRNTKETQIELRLNLDGRGKSDISTGIRFFDHMLDLVARHGAFDLKIIAKGDLDVYQHHTVEDVGIALGEAVNSALGNRKGILRAGYFLMPMDETLAAAAVDLSGRAFCIVKGKFSSKRVGAFQTELLEDFFQGFALSSRANVHLRVLYGRASHHQVEAVFKAFARALRFAVSRDKRLRNVLPSTKELL
ncbi:MAG TPA: imidazoleglycerol-phosphate dehydratase HisB [Candidatus Acidoferrum sp.]